MANIFKTPFADTGDRIAIPSSVQVDGSVSVPQGWGPDYEEPREISPGVPNPDYKPVGREEMNGILYEVTQAVGEIQVHGAALWSASAAPYPINATVYHNNVVWISTAPSNSTTPGAAGANWSNAFQRRFFSSGEPLPTSNVGPIWHDDYNSMMTWQVFNLNGASYTGYASQFIGQIVMDTQPTARTGYKRVGSETMALSRTQYAAIRAWAKHNGREVDIGVWQAGTLSMADNIDGATFRISDVRGEFPRFWDDGRGVDTGRVMGSQQSGQVGQHDLTVRVTNNSNASVSYASSKTTIGAGINLNGPDSWNTGQPTVANTTHQNTVLAGNENRPRNTAFTGIIKF